MQAQQNFTPEASVGLKFGATASRVNFEPAVKQKLHQDFTGGVVFKYISQPHLGVQAELNYVRKGWQENPETGTGFQRPLVFVELPFLTHVALGKNRFRFIINLGPRLAYLVSANDSLSLARLPTSQPYQAKPIDNVLQAGLALGLGFSQRTPIGNFQLEGRLNLDMINNFSSQQDMPSSQNQSLEVSMSYLIPFSTRKGAGPVKPPALEKVTDPK
jgi:hypothetical protein